MKLRQKHMCISCIQLFNQLESSQYVLRDTEYIIHVAADRCRCYVLLLFIITAR